MISQHKVIGLCYAHSQNLTCDDFINELHKFASLNGYRVILFAALTETGSGSEECLISHVFDALRFSVIDALIILDNELMKKETYLPICTEAGKVNVPVLIIGGENENCISLKEDVRPAFEELLKRSLESRAFGNTLLIAGHPDNDMRSRICTEAYRGIGSFKKTVAYGESKDAVTIEKLEGFIAENGYPDAVICTDDHMADSVCAYLESKGKKVPEDILVTGVGDIYSNDFFVHRYPTCRICPDEAAKTCIDIIRSFSKGEPVREQYSLPMTAVTRFAQCRNTEDVLSLTLRHEKHMYSWIEKLLASNDSSFLPYALSQIISSNSALCLNEKAFELFGNIDSENRKYTVIPSSRSNHGKTEIVHSDLQQIIPDALRWAQEDALCILHPLSMHGEYLGYYAITANEINADKFKYRRVMNTLKLVFDMMYLRYSRQGDNAQDEMLQRINLTTGLPNMTAAREWFEHFSEKAENHNKCLSVSIYCLPKYNFIYENYGIYDIHDALKFIAEALQKANENNDHYIAHVSPDRFMVLNIYDDGEKIGDTVNAAVSSFFKQVEEYNAVSKKDFFIEVNCGCTIAASGWKEDLESYLQYAGNEMYKNQLHHGPADTVKHSRIGKDQYSTFSYLLDNSLFTYHFQPIVDAKTGSIYGYEALMRTGGGIKMSPVDVLNMAKEFGRLYDVERATFFGIMEYYTREFDVFRGRKLFMNTIPGNFLTREDCDELWDKYHNMMDHFVYEITEQDSVSDEELNALKLLSKDRMTNQVAIDDFGTGHSNIANLIRYTPGIVKIDRFLISNIPNDTNKQMFVKNTIEFAKHNGIMVLAEGVETADEMRTVIEYGVDLIQGYYTAKPSPEPIVAIPPEIKKEIIAENLRLSRFDNDMMIYDAENGETVDIIALALRKYTYVTVPEGRITFTGEKDSTVDLVIRVPDDRECEITFDNVNIRGAVETTLQIGHNCTARIILKGENTFNKEGILVPPDSELILSGDGSLTINNNRNFSVGIGANYNDACGNITVDMTGELSIFSSGDKVIGIGGGKGNDRMLRFVSGDIQINARGINVVGIGCAKENINVSIEEKAEIGIFCSGDYAVGLGSQAGNAFIRNNGMISATADGETASAIGTLNGAEGRVLLSGGKVNATVHCNTGCSIGSVSGRISIENAGGRTQVYGEGNRVRGFGSIKGSALFRADGGIVAGSLQAAEGYVFGSRNDRFIVNSGNIICEGDDANLYNDFGNKLIKKQIEEKSYDSDIVTPDGTYHYHAERDKVTDKLIIYVPES